MSSDAVSNLDSCRTEQKSSLNDNLSAIPCGKCEHYCSDLLNPGLLRSELSLLRRNVSPGFVRLYSHRNQRCGAEATEMRLSNEKSNVRTCDVESRHVVLGRVGAGRCHRTTRQRHQCDARIMGMPDKGIPEEVLEHAKCIAVVPQWSKAHLSLEAKGGKGVASCRTADGWSRRHLSRFRAETGGCSSV